MRVIKVPVRALRRLVHAVIEEVAWDTIEEQRRRRMREREVESGDRAAYVLDADEIETRERIRRRWEGEKIKPVLKLAR